MKSRLSVICLAMSAVSSTFGDDTATALKDAFVVIRTSDQNVAAGADQSAQRAAWKKITQSPDADMLVVLAQMKGAGPIAQNWLRAAADAIAQRHFEPGKSLPLDRLEKFVLKRDESPRARRVAFEWIDVVDETIRPRLLPKLLDDPSLELRYEAVAAEMARAEKLEGAEAVAAFKKAFIAARDLEQVKKCAEALKKLESPVNRAEHFGFVTDWHLIGLFDNKDRAGYAKEFPPEKQVDLSAKYQSLDKEVTWIEHHTDHQEGDVDLNKVYGEIKEVLAYAAGEVDSDSEREAQIRINCIAACKVWLNGELVIDHEVYHAGYKFDQYVANVRLNKGRNTILVKCCQNEQTQSWANVWKFALRVCDDLGGGIK